MKKLLFFVAAMCMFIPTTFALPESCSGSEYSELINKTKKVEVSFTFDMYNGYTVNVSNIDPDLYAKDVFDLVYDGGSTGIASVTLYSNGNYVLVPLSYYNLTFYAKDGTNCAGEVVDVVQTIIPKYNEYSESLECAENPDDEYCAMLISFNLTEKQFDKRFNPSGTVSDVENKEDTNTNENNIEDNTEESSNIYFIIGGILLVVIVIVSLVVFNMHTKKIRKQREKQYANLKRGNYNSSNTEDIIDNDKE